MTCGQSGMFYSPIIVLIVVLDQVTKYLCVKYIDYGTVGIEVFSFFNLVHVYNHGAAFSFLSDMGGWQRWFFIAVAVIISILFVVMLRKTSRSHCFLCLSYVLFVGGAIGNLIDRLYLGYVIDFLLFYWRFDDGVWAYPAFNVADISVSVGAFLLIVCTIFGRDHAEGSGDEGDAGAEKAKD